MKITHIFSSAMWHLPRETFDLATERLNNVRRMIKTGTKTSFSVKLENNHSVRPQTMKTSCQMTADFGLSWKGRGGKTPNWQILRSRASSPQAPCVPEGLRQCASDSTANSWRLPGNVADTPAVGAVELSGKHQHVTFIQEVCLCNWMENNDNNQ